MHGTRGHSLVEVMVAGVVIVAGILPVAVAIGAGVQLATRGRLRAEAALAIMSRIELLRAEAGRSSAACAALAGGTAVVQGRQESWTVTGSAEAREVEVQVSVPNPRAPVADSVRVFIRCP